jgi:hypothetical protein
VVDAECPRGPFVALFTAALTGREDEGAGLLLRCSPAMSCKVLRFVAGSGTWVVSDLSVLP